MNMRNLCCLVVFVAAVKVAAADTVNLQPAMLDFDLPPGYRPSPAETVQGVTKVTFKAPDSPMITTLAIPIEQGFADAAEVFQSQIDAIRDSLPGEVSAIQLDAFDLGGYPAQWGVLDIRSSGAASMRAGVGVVEFDDYQIAMVVFMATEVEQARAADYEAAFLTLRPEGMDVAEVAERVAVDFSTGSAAGESAPPSVYDHPLFSLNLGAGWTATTVSDNPRAINLATIAGPDKSSLIVLCLTGLAASNKTMDEATYGSLSSNLPSITPVASERVKAANGKMVNFRQFQGRTEAQGNTIILDGLTASVKHKKCMLGFIGVGKPLAQMREIVLSVH